MKLALLRHGPTEWNAVGRVQGSIEIGLSQAGRNLFAARALPPDLQNWRAFTSPQGRARETALLLGLAATEDARLAEQNWGRWEGLTRHEILKHDGAEAFSDAGAGAAFRPPGGESTAELMARVADFLVDVAKDEGDAVAVAHLGVLRAAYTLATGWAMDTPMPADLDPAGILVLSLDKAGVPALAELNRDFSRKA